MTPPAKFKDEVYSLLFLAVPQWQYVGDVPRSSYVRTYMRRQSRNAYSGCLAGSESEYLIRSGAHGSVSIQRLVPGEWRETDARGRAYRAPAGGAWHAARATVGA